MMKINWKVRFRNKVWLTAFVSFAISTAYQLCDMLGVTPPVGEDGVMQGVALVLQLLSLLGIITDPTTAGFCDSERALCYERPTQTSKEI